MNSRNLKLVGLALITAMMYVFTYQYRDLDIVRSNLEDMAFDTIYSFPFVGLSEHHTQMDQAPYVINLLIDDEYLVERNLSTDKSEPNYGYVFPRNELAKIINDVDLKSHELKVHSLFLDYDLSFSSLVGGREFSNEDKVLLNTLKKERSYDIYLPVTMYQNVFYDELKNYPHIKFVSVGLNMSNDGKVRRFQASSYGKPVVSLGIYASILEQKLRVDNDGSVIVGSQTFKHDDVIENRIFLKTMQNNAGSVMQSNWDRFLVTSVRTLEDLSFSNKDLDKGSCLIVGSSYNYSTDKFSTILDDEISGSTLHAHALMTHFYLGDHLKPMSIYYAASLLFLMAYISMYIIQKQLKGLSHLKLVAISYFMILCVMFILSYVMLVWYNLWFNWIIVFVVYSVSTSLLEASDNLKKLIRAVQSFIKKL